MGHKIVAVVRIQTDPRTIPLTREAVVETDDEVTARVVFASIVAHAIMIGVVSVRWTEGASERAVWRLQP
jgi:hypothetical protein